MRKTWAIARNLISESLRMKVAVGFLVLLTGILACLPLLMKGDGTLTGRVQTFLSYSLWSLAFILGILTIFVSCGSLAGEVENKHAFLTATKPVTRGQMMIGKWLGVALLDLVLLGIGGGMIFATVQYMRRLPGTHALDRFTLESEPNDTLDQVKAKERALAAITAKDALLSRWRRVADARRCDAPWSPGATLLAG